MKLAEITPSTIERFLEKSCRSSTRHKFYVSLNVLWKTYFIGVTRLTKYNPLAEVEPPVRPTSKRKEPYTCEEVFKLLDELDEPTINRSNIADLARMGDSYVRKETLHAVILW